MSNAISMSSSTDHSASNGLPRSEEQAVAALGIVVIGRNEGERLAACLQSLPRKNPCVYVDSGSSDGSVELARSNGVKVHELQAGIPFTASRARAEGAAVLLDSHPELEAIQFLDGDCTIEDGWLEKALATLAAQPSVAAVCGRRRERYPEKSHYNAMFDDEWDTPIGEAESTGGDAVFRVKPYREVGGFNPAITAGEEPELNHRLRANGWRIMRIDAPMSVHDADMHHFSQWWQRTLRSGYGYFQAFRATRGGTGPALYSRELARAFGWTLVVPMFAVLIAILVNPLWLLLAPALWLAQYLRLSLKLGSRQAFHLMIGKFGETLGALKAAWAGVRRSSESAITYK